MKSKQLTKSEGQLDLNWTKHFDYIFNSVGVDIETYDIYANKERTKINEKEFIRYSEGEFKDLVTTSWSLKRYFLELNLEEIVFKQNDASGFEVEWNWFGKLKYSTTKKHKFVKLKLSGYNDCMEFNKNDDIFGFSFLNVEPLFF